MRGAVCFYLFFLCASNTNSKLRKHCLFQYFLWKVSPYFLMGNFLFGWKVTESTEPEKNINSIQKEHFWSCSSLKSVTHVLQWWNLPQLYLTQRRSKNYMDHMTHPLSSAEISSIFSSEISKFCFIKKYRYRLHFDS